METFLSLFGPRLKEARKALGLSQSEAADLVGITREHWGRCEREIAVPGGEVLAALARAGADVNYILTGQRSSAAPAPTPALTADEREMLTLFKSATLTGKAAAIGALQGAAGAAHAPKIHIAGGAHHGQIADVIHNTTTTRAPARPRRT